MALRGHEVRVIDYEYMQKADLLRPAVHEREVHPKAHKVFKDADVTLIRPKAIKGAGISTLSLPYFHAKEIRRQISEFQPDIIVAFGILNAYVGIQLAHKHRIPYVYYLIDHLHTLLPHWSMRVVAKKVERYNIRHADNILVINKGLKDYVVKMGGDPNNVAVIPAGVNLARFNPSVSGSEIRLAHGIGEDDTLLFFMGHLYSFSGLKEVAAALRSSEISHLKLMIVGDGGIYSELLNISAESDLRNKLIVVGKVPFSEVPRYVAAADICLLPAYKNKTMENIVPIKMYEYLAMGRPVIATCLPGIVKEFGFENGVIYIDSAEDVVTKARDMIERDVLGEEGKKASMCVKDCDWDTITDAFEAQLNILITKQASQ
jgi:glycosyltransferase involved in cell wall biosynthesis